jgi:hypothetical protein
MPLLSVSIASSSANSFLHKNAQVLVTSDSFVSAEPNEPKTA